jgi:hypothetical protein
MPLSSVLLKIFKNIFHDTQLIKFAETLPFRTKGILSPIIHKSLTYSCEVLCRNTGMLELQFWSIVHPERSEVLYPSREPRSIYT